MNVAEYLLRGKISDKPALLPLGRAHSYGELSEAVARTASYLVGSGLAKGERVLLVSENSFLWVCAYLAALHAGLVVVPLPTTSSDEDLRYIIEASAPRLAFVAPNILARHRQAFDPIPALTELPRDGSTASPARGEGNDLAALMFTSGSTGRPRGVMVSHRNIIANTDSIIAALNLTDHDRMMTVLPFHYCFGTSLLHTHLCVGGTLVLENRFLFPEVVLQRMRETECTSFAGVPSHYQILLRRSSLAKVSFPHLRCLQQAGGHLAPVFVRELRRALPQTALYIMYGQTEATARLSYLPPEMLGRKPASVGIAIPGVKLAVLNDADQPAAPGEVGEIVAEGENIAAGYWHDKVETARLFRNGRLHTGDLARMDEDGFLYIVDRVRDFLKCGGKRLSCRELEDTLAEMDDVLEAAVIGVPDEVLGEAVKAFVVPRNIGSVDFDARLRAFCKRRLPPTYTPKQIVMLRALPKNSAGKTSKATLRNFY